MPQPSPYLEELLKEQYKWELERHDRINQSLSLPIGVVVLLVGVLAYCGRTFSTCTWGPWSCVLAFLTLSLLAAVILAVVFLTHSFYGYKYAYLSTAGEFFDYATELEQHYSSQPRVALPALVEDRIRRLLIVEYAKCATRNTQNNDTKSKYRHRAATCIAIALAILFLILVPLCAVSLCESVSPVQKVQLMGPSGKGQDMTDDGSDQEQIPPVPEPQPDEPQPPKVRIIKESRDVPEKTPDPESD